MDESHLATLVVRAEPGAAVVAQLEVPFGTARREGGVLVVGQRPDEWHLVGPVDDVAPMRAALDTTGHVSVVDLSHGRARMRLTGRRAAAVLEKVCSLDWSDPMTPDLAATSASVAKVTCDVVRDDRDQVPSYVVSCDRSFGQYLFDAVLDAGAEFGVVVG